MIDGRDFPQFTTFRGGDNARLHTSYSTTTTVDLAERGQRLEGVKITHQNGSSEFQSVRTLGPECSIENVTIEESSGDGIYLNASRCSMRNVVCKSGGISGKDIGIDSAADNCRIIGCDGAITDNSGTAALSANTDSA